MVLYKYIFLPFQLNFTIGKGGLIGPILYSLNVFKSNHYLNFILYVF